MTTNPNNAIGTNAAFGGRTSVNAFNDDLSAFSRGIMSGWECTPAGGMTLSLGGDSTVRDVAIAEDEAGNRTTINNISISPISITISGAPASNTRIDSIVAYVDNPPQGTATITDNYEACGLIVVEGTASSSPVAPSEATIRNAITTDGASGATAYYVVLADITVATGTTDLSSANILRGTKSGLISENYSTTEVDTGAKWIDGSRIFKKSIHIDSFPNNSTKYVPHGIPDLKRLIKLEGWAFRTTDAGIFPLPFASNNPANVIAISLEPTNIDIATGVDRTSLFGFITLYYTRWI